MKIPVLTAAAGAAWEARLVVALTREGHGVEVVRRCVDVVDLLAVAASGQGRVALLDAGLARLNPAAVDRLTAAGVIAIGVVPRGDHAAEDQLRAVGVELTVPHDAAGAVLAGVVEQAVRSSAAQPLDHTGDRAFADPARASSAVPPALALSLPVGDDARRWDAVTPSLTPESVPERATGSLIAVWGPTGAPGRTTVAVTLADELARLGADVLLVDADVYGGVIAPTLGLLDDSPGIAAACRQAGAHRLDAAALAGLAWTLGERLRVLTGIPRADRWPELRPSAFAAVLTAARGLADFTVVDVGFNVETDEELSFDTVAPRRNGATLTALDSADVVVAVGSADPIGVQRLVRGLAELRTAEIDTPVWIVANKVRGQAMAGTPESELAAVLQRFVGQHPAAYLPADSAAVDAALAAGQTLAEACPGSRLRRAVVELAAALADVPAPASTGRGLRGRWSRRTSAGSSRGRRRSAGGVSGVGG